MKRDTNIHHCMYIRSIWLHLYFCWQVFTPCHMHSCLMQVCIFMANPVTATYTVVLSAMGNWTSMCNVQYIRTRSNSNSSSSSNICTMSPVTAFVSIPVLSSYTHIVWGARWEINHSVVGNKFIFKQSLVVHVHTESKAVKVPSPINVNWRFINWSNTESQIEIWRDKSCM